MSSASIRIAFVSLIVAHTIGCDSKTEVRPSTASETPVVPDSSAAPAPAIAGAGGSAIGNPMPSPSESSAGSPAAVGGSAGAPSTPAPPAAAPSEMDGGCPTFDSTFAAVQKAIFDNHGCSADACHGTAASGGLDLRTGTSYKNLLQVKAQGSAQLRIQPGSPQESYLYLKLKAATVPGSVSIANSPMPVGLPPLSEDELEAVRLWILGGAPEKGSVGDPTHFGTSDSVAHRLNVCLPKAEPIRIAPLEAPAPMEGIQFVSPQWTLGKGEEREICVATYYDFTTRIPAEFKSPDGAKFYTNGSRLRQDPGSHHYVLSNPNIPESYTADPAFGKWTCRGDREGQGCDPVDSASCGNTGVCSSELADGVACMGFGPFVLGSDGLLTEGLIENVQATNQYLPPREGVYRELPIKGFLYHNVHAFNLTDKDAPLQTRLNVMFAKDRRRRLDQAIDYSNVFLPAGIPPYTKKQVCAKHVAPLGAEMIRLTSHTHKRGKHFWITGPDSKMIYESFLYSDPLYKEFDPGIIYDGATDASRTLTACAEYNNGVADDGTPDPEAVTRYSRLPDRTQCTPVACVAGKIGAACSGADDNATCDSKPGAADGACDACPITGGPTTEDEMFVIMPWYVLPEGQ